MQKNTHLDCSNIGLLAETSWEVCNKIGGIYTVLSTKARVLQEQYGDRLVFIGPDVWTEENPSPYFKERKKLLSSFSSKAELPFGIKVRTGRWNIPGSPQVILVKFDELYSHLNEIYGQMWNLYGVDSIHAYGDYDEGCAYAVATAIVINALVKHIGLKPSEVLAHFNEWTTAMGLLYMKKISPESMTVFTTHATSIGRSICGNGKPLYDYFEGYNGDQMSHELNMDSKHSLEKSAAHQADCFTAVSEITARECAQLLDIRPQVVTPNGFEPDFVPGNRKFTMQRKTGRNRILSIAAALKGKPFPSDTLIIATSGRNEYRNKGLDLYLDSLSELERMNPGKEVIALVLVPSWVKEPSSELSCAIQDNGCVSDSPDFLTHRLNNEDSDAVACRIRSLEAEGRFKDKVSVIYVPCYLDGCDGIIGISYYDLLPALDITVFASYYEPWGYTPLESVAFGVPTITSDKSGFGQWILSEYENSLDKCGVKVVERGDSDYWESCGKIARQLHDFANATPEQRKVASEKAKATAGKADWKLFFNAYEEAFAVACKRRNERLKTNDKRNNK